MLVFSDLITKYLWLKSQPFIPSDVFFFSGIVNLLLLLELLLLLLKYLFVDVLYWKLYPDASCVYQLFFL